MDNETAQRLAKVLVGILKRIEEAGEGGEQDTLMVRGRRVRVDPRDLRILETLRNVKNDMIRENESRKRPES